MKHTATSKATRQISTPPILRVSNLKHAYKGHRALQGVTFQIHPGEIFGILGPNGSGKSTLFKILSTFLLPSSGDATIAGQSILTNSMDVRERLGVVFQSFGLDSKLTVHENLLHQGHLYGLQGEILEERIKKLLEDFGIAERANSRIDTLSGGLQRRVEIAKGLLHAPMLLLLDEPSTGLDPGARLDLWRYLEFCRKKAGTTIVLTTHLIDEADQCDRIAIMDHGQVVAEGSPADLKGQIGGDVVVVESPDADTLSRKIKRRFRLDAQRVGGELLIEAKEGHRLIPKLAQAFPKLIESLTLRKPTLEDVFMRKTGHRLWDEGTTKDEAA